MLLHHRHDVFLLSLILSVCVKSTKAQRPPFSPSSPSFSKNVSITESHRNFIRDMALEAWNTYERYAWGADSVRPSGKEPYNVHFGSNSGHSILASMSTLWTMGLMEEFERGKAWIAEKLHFDRIDETVNVHLTMTEFVGGLLSCYALTGEELFLEKAINIAETLEPAWRTPTDLPSESVNPKQGYHTGSKNSLSGVGGSQLEYLYLGQLTDNSLYTQRVAKLRSLLRKKITNQYYGSSVGYMDMIDVQEGGWFYSSHPTTGQTLTLSLFEAGRDYYQSLLKTFIQSAGRDVEAFEMFKSAVKMAEEIKLFSASNSSLIYTRAYYFNNDKYGEYMNFEGCYLGALLGVGGRLMDQGLTKNRSMDASVRKSEIAHVHRVDLLASGITETCQIVSRSTATGLAPEKFLFNEKEDGTNFGSTLENLATKQFHLSPELAESYFVLYRLTKNEKYRIYAWELAQAIYKHCRIEGVGGYSIVSDVDQVPTVRFGHQPAIFLSATLKYLYLIFSEDDVLPLDSWVFNVAGHPIPVDK